MQKVNKFKKYAPQILILLFGFFYIIIRGGYYYVEPHNEGAILYGSKLVSEGYLPYKDFWSINSPGIYLLLGLLFNLFGTKIIIAKILTIVTNILLSLIIYLISIKTLKRGKLLPFILSFSWLGGFYFYGNTVVYGLLFALLSGYFLFVYFETKSEKWFHLAGIAIGITAVFRHEMGAYLFGAIFQAIFFFNLSNEKIIQEKLWTKVKFGLRKAFTFGLFTLAPLPIAIYLLANIDLNDLWQALIIQPFTIYREFESTPFPMPSENPLDTIGAFVFYLPLVVFIFSIISIIRRTRKKTLELNGVQFWKEMTLFNLGINLFNHAQVISDLSHVMPAMLVAGILLFYHLNREKYQISYSFIFISLIIYLPISQRLKFKDQLNENLVLNGSVVTFDDSYINNNYLYYVNYNKGPVKHFNMQKGITDSINKYDYLVDISNTDYFVSTKKREKIINPVFKEIREIMSRFKLIDSSKNRFVYKKNQ